MDTIALIFYTFLPCFVILAVAGLAYLVMLVLPEPVKKILQFNFTDPSANRRKEKPPGKRRK